MIKVRYTALMLFSLFALSACDSHSSKGPDDSSGSTPQKQSLLLSTSFGGAHHLGSWQIFDSDTLKLNKGISLEGAHYIGDGIEQEESGFVWNPITKLFYAILPNSSYNGSGVLVSFNPRTDELKTLTSTYHAALIDDYPLSSYNQPPVVSPDGKALIVVAQHGGPKSNCPVEAKYCDQPGGLVHINIDPSSTDYLKFTSLYSFAEFGSLTTDGLHNVKTRPLLVKSGGESVIFLIAEGYGWIINDVKTFVQGRPFALKPSNNSDWTDSWEIIGNFPQLSRENLTDRISPDPIYIASQDLFIWTTDVSGDEFYVESQQGLYGSHNLMILNHPNTKCYSPTGFISPIGSNYYQLFCAGLDELNDGNDVIGKLLGISKNFNSTGVLRTFSNWLYDESSFSRLHPYAFSQPFDSSVFISGSTQSADDWYLSPLGIGFLPSEVVELNTIDFTITKLFTGNENIGLSFIGRPSLGGYTDDPIEHRYLVQLTRFGGEYNRGSVIKYDRLTHEISATPLGMKDFSLLRGKPYQLNNNKILGASNIYHNKDFEIYDDYQSTSYILNPKDYKAENNSIKDIPVEYFNDGKYQTYMAPFQGYELAFATTKSGELWTSSYYPSMVQYSTAKGPGLGILRFNKDTGANEEGFMIEPLHGGFGHAPSQVSALDNKLFVTHTLTVDGKPDERGFCIDIENRDSNNVPSYTSSPLSGNEQLFVEPTLTRKVVWGATEMEGKIFVMTVPDTNYSEGGNDARIHEVDLSSCSTTGPTYTTRLTGLSDIASTRMLAASDGMLYYGTSNGKLMAFDPMKNSVNLVSDYKNASSSEIRGYLTETSNGEIVGLLFDFDDNNIPIGRRAFKYKISSDSTSFSDVSKYVPHTEMYVGFIGVQL
jgi:hypothetical protein